MWIKTISRLIYKLNKNNNKKHICLRCLHIFSREDLLNKHKPDCKGINCGTVVEEGKNIMKFKNYKNIMQTPYVIYADFESVLQPIEDVGEGKTIKRNEHKACGYSYVVARYDGKIENDKLYRGTCATDKFLVDLQDEEKKILDIFRNPIDMNLSEDEEVSFQNENTCWICNKGFEEINTLPQDCSKCEEVKAKGKYPKCYNCNELKKKNQNNKKCRDHCHITGKYRGAAHGGCNFQLKIGEKTQIPVVFHNLRGYDSHLIMQSISNFDGDLKCIPNNTEKYISFSLGNLKFIDSYSFLGTSLEKLVNAMSKEDFKITPTKFEGDKLELILRKGVYPYEYMNSFERFNEEILPEQKSFYSSLTDNSISDLDYEHAKNVWRTFGCENLGDYHDVYLKSDVLLLADVFQCFRKNCLKNYELDPANYYTLPGLSWDALMKKSGVELELLTDIDMHLMFEKGLRGGISMVSHRYSKANNKYLPDTYDPNIDSSYLMYLDANNLYGWSMSQPLPIGGFKWIKPTDVINNKILNTSASYPKGYILEVDLEYPKELHSTHNDYPLAPESLLIQKEWMSDYQLSLAENDGIPKVKKLTPNLMNKEKYVLHYRNLQLYLDLETN